MEGIIIKGIGGFYYIKTDEGIIECKARGKFRYNSLKPMVGDRVTIKSREWKRCNRGYTWEKLRAYKTNCCKRNTSFRCICNKKSDINLDLLNRFLTLCEYNDIHAVVCLNKEDLCTEEEKENLKELINDIGYEVLFINAKEGKGFDALKERLEHNITVLCGPSGAGKSTLLNSFIDREHMETGSVSEKIGRGKHTTRHSELIDVDNGYLVDTPGFTTLDVTFIDRDSLKYCFPEFNDYNNLCKFNGCNHYKEPKCAVKEAVEEGKINKLRYEFYIKTLEEIINRRGN